MGKRSGGKGGGGLEWSQQQNRRKKSVFEKRRYKTEPFSKRAYTRGRTYVRITYISKENNLGQDDKIRYIWGLKGPIFILYSAAGSP